MNKRFFRGGLSLFFFFLFSSVLLAENPVELVKITSPGYNQTVYDTFKVEGEVIFREEVEKDTYVVMVSEYSPDRRYHLKMKNGKLLVDSLRPRKSKGKYIAKWKVRNIRLGKRGKPGRKGNKREEFDIQAIVLKSSEQEKFFGIFCKKVTPGSCVLDRKTFRGMDKKMDDITLSNSVTIIKY